MAYELSPFLAAAQPYAAALGHPPWLRRRTVPGRAFHALAFGNVALSGLPLAILGLLPQWMSLGMSLGLPGQKSRRRKS